MGASVDAELLALFGRWTLATAQVKRLEELNVDLEVIQSAAREVVMQRGHPEAQRAIVDALSEDTAVALCIWMRDSNNAASLVTYAKAAAKKRK